MPQLHFLSEASELSHISKLCALMCTMIAYILCHWGSDRKKTDLLRCYLLHRILLWRLRNLSFPFRTLGISRTIFFQSNFLNNASELNVFGWRITSSYSKLTCAKSLSTNRNCKIYNHSPLSCTNNILFLSTTSESGLSM